MLKKLARLADHLDKLGKLEEANYVDDIIKKISSDQMSLFPSEASKSETVINTSASKLAEMLVRGSLVSESDDARMLSDSIKNILNANPEVSEALWKAVSASTIKEEADEDAGEAMTKFPPGYLHFYLSDGETPFRVEEEGSRWEGARSYPLIVSMKQEYKLGQEIVEEGNTFIITEEGKAVLK